MQALIYIMLYLRVFILVNLSVALNLTFLWLFLIDSTIEDHNDITVKFLAIHFDCAVHYVLLVFPKEGDDL